MLNQRTYRLVLQGDSGLLRTRYGSKFDTCDLAQRMPAVQGQTARISKDNRPVASISVITALRLSALARAWD